MSSSALVPSPAASGSAQLVITADDFMPFSVERVLARQEARKKIIANLLIPDVDFGEQPGSTDKKSVLKLAGAEKLMSAFGLAPRIVKETKIKDWTGADHGGEAFFEYEYTIALYRGELFLGEATASCNSWEKKYRYQWVSEDQARDRPDFAKLWRRGGKKIVFEPDFALEKRQTDGRYGKPIEYWNRFDEALQDGSAQRIQKQLGKKTYLGYQIEIDDAQVRIPNPNAPDLVNTVQKISYKRALVAVVKGVTNCSDAFTQDIGDDDEDQTPEPLERAKPEPVTDAQMVDDADIEKPAPRAIPEEMRLMIENLRRNPKEITEDYAIMWRRAEKRGEEARRAHEAMNQAFRNRFPKGSPGMSSVENHVNQLLDLYELELTFAQ